MKTPFRQKSPGPGRGFFCVLLLLVWELWVKLSHVSPMLFPSVEDVTVTLWEDLFHGSLLAQTLSSLGLIGLAVMAVVIFLDASGYF